MQTINQFVEKESAEQSINQGSSDESLSKSKSINNSLNKDIMNDDEAVYRIDVITETNDDDIYDLTVENDIASEIDAINILGHYAIQTGPDTLVILSEGRALTESELEQLRRVDERVSNNTIVLSGGFANVLLNESSAQSSQEFSF